MENKEPSELSTVPRPMERENIRYTRADMLEAWVAGWDNRGSRYEDGPGDAPDFATWIRGYAPSDPSGTDSSSATGEKDLEEPGAVAANTRGGQIKRALKSIELAFRAISGGAENSQSWDERSCRCDPEANAYPCEYCAIYDALKLAKKCLSENGSESASATSVSSEKDVIGGESEPPKSEAFSKDRHQSSPSSSAAVIEEEKWRVTIHGGLDIMGSGPNYYVGREQAEAIKDAHNASLERVRKKAEKELGK